VTYFDRLLFTILPGVLYPHIKPLQTSETWWSSWSRSTAQYCTTVQTIGDGHEMVVGSLVYCHSWPNGRRYTRRRTVGV